MTQTANRSRGTVYRASGGAPAATPRPARRSRLLGVDAARGIALLGMIAVHSLYQSDAAGRSTWSFTIFGGRAAALFAVLAGVGVAFMTDRRRVRLTAGSGPVAALVVRALVIGAIGLALGYTDASLASVILPYYAVMFLLAIPLVFLPTWLVAVTCVVVAAGSPALRQILLPQLPEPTYDNPAFAHLVDDAGALLTELAVTGEFPAMTWLAYLCAGLVIGRLILTRMKVVLGLLITGVALAAAAPVASSILLDRYEGLRQIWFTQPKSGLTTAETTALLTLGGDGSTPTSTWWWLAVDAPHTSTPLDLVGTTGSAIALLAVLLLAGRVARPSPRLVIRVLLIPLAAAGSMTLTLYTAHIMFINSELDSFEPMTGYLAQVLAILLLGTAWSATAGRGPLEGLTAVLSRGARRLAIRRGGSYRARMSSYWEEAPRAGDHPVDRQPTRWPSG
ncbi:putative membrane protein [Micromonospora sp. A200]|uniref:heparan-alpha-glucosaminide N-acetyltransferase domain-containing protein n=1 Tax=Micromonospora sp. A200 TaxID=2940568 RepID=UPI0024757F66|nr:heparan-alpha-glucosaminide N-acetyltransferase domain-containing protein [Micromonospora sp. A200]MDH6464779.1 putative membrane protein [Micromonospora sp. A200]